MRRDWTLDRMAAFGRHAHQFLRLSGIKTGRAVRIGPAFLLLSLLAACGSTTERTDATPVRFSLQNTGATPISCRLIYGHWVERDYGELAPGESRTDRFAQQEDGGLFTMRPDGAARMMIESIQCARYPDWLATVGQVDFAPARRAKVSALAARCAMPTQGGRIACEALEMTTAP